MMGSLLAITIASGMCALVGTGALVVAQEVPAASTYANWTAVTFLGAALLMIIYQLARTIPVVTGQFNSAMDKVDTSYRKLDSTLTRLAEQCATRNASVVPPPIPDDDEHTPTGSRRVRTQAR